MFNENSGLVIIWARLVKAGVYTIDQVPSISNLRDVVHQVIEAGA
ncbi:MAG: CD1375 family protein [Candidatus Fimivivens sp.]